ncbi:hypothetical protein ACFLQU_01005 [Verrucomicrobiota bacterium]
MQFLAEKEETSVQGLKFRMLKEQSYDRQLLHYLEKSSFVQKCAACNGTKMAACSGCKGTGVCRKCMGKNNTQHGLRLATYCRICNGTGKCQSCEGRRRTGCVKCRGVGTVLSVKKLGVAFDGHLEFCSHSLASAVSDKGKIAKAKERAELGAAYSAKYQKPVEEEAKSRGQVLINGRWVSSDTAVQIAEAKSKANRQARAADPFGLGTTVAKPSTRQQREDEEMRRRAAKYRADHPQETQRPTQNARPTWNARSYLRMQYPYNRGVYTTPQAAQHACDQLNALQSGQIDALRESGYSGNTGIRVGRWTYTWDRHLRAYVVYQK